MYFIDRAQAGRQLVGELTKFKGEQVAVIAMTPGAVLIGAEVAKQLHAALMQLFTEHIFLPSEPDPLAAVTTRTFTYNDVFSTGELEELAAEFHGFIEEQRIEKFHALNRLMGADGEIKAELLRHHVVILVSDCLVNGFSLSIAADFLKPIAIARLVCATPLATVPAVDRMHALGDELHCLNVIENFFGVNHYYDNNTIPDQAGLRRIMRNLPVNWAVPED